MDEADRETSGPLKTLFDFLFDLPRSKMEW